MSIYHTEGIKNDGRQNFNTTKNITQRNTYLSPKIQATQSEIPAAQQKYGTSTTAS
jgi:hypothetical protein